MRFRIFAPVGLLVILCASCGTDGDLLASSGAAGGDNDADATLNPADSSTGSDTEGLSAVADATDAANPPPDAGESAEDALSEVAADADLFSKDSLLTDDGDSATGAPDSLAAVADSATGDAPNAPIDSDGDGVPDDVEKWFGTDPNNPDTDGDGVPDGQEIKDKTDPLKADTDGDGLADGQEKALGTDPLKADTDGDGLTDGEEVQKYKTDPKSADTDKDGIPDGVEVGKAGDADPTTTTDPNKADSDGDGVPDGAEDKNKNGKVDPGESDPNNGKDGGVPPNNDPCAGKNCDDGNVCTTDSCDGVKGCGHAANVLACDDGNPATVDACKGGVCAWTGNGCPGFVNVPGGVLDPATVVFPFWIYKRAVLRSEYQACVDAGACVAVNVGYVPQIPYGGTCAADVNVACAAKSCLCSATADEPMGGDYVGIPGLGDAQAYCAWKGGNVPTAAQIAWAASGIWSFDSPVIWPTLTAALPLANVPSKVYDKIRFAGLLSLTSTGKVDNYSQTGIGDFLLPINVTKQFGPSQFTPGGTGIYCTYDTKPVCN